MPAVYPVGGWRQYVDCFVLPWIHKASKPIMSWMLLWLYASRVPRGWLATVWRLLCLLRLANATNTFSRYGLNTWLYASRVPRGWLSTVWRLICLLRLANAINTWALWSDVLHWPMKCHHKYDTKDCKTIERRGVIIPALDTAPWGRAAVDTKLAVHDCFEDSFMWVGFAW